MNQTDFKKVGDIIAKNVSQQIKPGIDDQTVILRSLKNDLRGVSGRLGHIEDQIDILKQEVRETKEETKEIRETSDALLGDMIDVQKQVGAIWDVTKVIDDKFERQNQRIGRLEVHVGIAE